MDWIEWFQKFKNHMSNMDLPVCQDDNDYQQLFFANVSPEDAADLEFKTIVSYCD